MFRQWSPSWILITGALFFIGCKEKETELPYLGQVQTENSQEKHHTVGTFRYLNQDSIWVDNASLSDYVYVADFFFTSCPSICPKVTKEMMRIHDAFRNEPMVRMVSFTIDPKRDDVQKLKLYADNLGIDQSKWWFLTGDKDATLELANTFFVAALEDPDAPGGFDHSGKIVLVDKEGHVRSFSEGTDPGTTPKLIGDIQWLVGHYKNQDTKQ
jgi:protein SCO1/2